MSVYVCTEPECGVLWTDTKVAKNPRKTAERRRCPDCVLMNKPGPRKKDKVRRK